MHEKPLAALRGDMAELGIARAPGLAEPEDHIASLAESMAGLIAGDFAATRQRSSISSSATSPPWAGRFFADLEGAEAAWFYRPVGALGRHLIEIETTAYALAA
ncbi:MAG: molecular chaperone TorD family protein [Geminicoccaceae bacterium]